MRNSTSWLGLFLVLAIFLLFSCCDTETTETVQSVKEEIYLEEEVQVVYGNYFLFETTDKQEYLNFLENFDENKYEVVDISIGRYGDSGVRYYMVTYKVREFEAE